LDFSVLIQVRAATRAECAVMDLRVQRKTQPTLRVGALNKPEHSQTSLGHSEQRVNNPSILSFFCPDNATTLYPQKANFSLLKAKRLGEGGTQTFDEVIISYYKPNDK
jgi:hypothetical protein